MCQSLEQFLSVTTNIILILTPQIATLDLKILLGEWPDVNLNRMLLYRAPLFWATSHKKWEKLG